MLYVKVVATVPSKLSSFASTVTRAETSLDDVNGVWQKDRGGKFNNYLNVDVEVQDVNGKTVSLEGYVPVEAELRLVMEDGELGTLIDRVDLNSKRVMNKHLEGNAGKLMIIDADPVSGAGLRIGGAAGKTTIKTRINELSKKGSRNSRFSVLYRPVGPGSERFIVDPELARSRPLTIYSKVVKSAKEEALSNHLEQAKLAAKTLLSEVEKVDPAEAASGSEAEVVMEILEACRLIQRKLQWQQARAHGNGNHRPGKGVFDILDAALQSNAAATAAASSSSLSGPVATHKRNEEASSAEEEDAEDEGNGHAELEHGVGTPSDFNISTSSLLDDDNKRQRLGSTTEWSSGRLNIVCNPALDVPEDFSIDFVEDYIRELEREDGVVPVSTSFNITENGISISLFDDNNDGQINRDEMARGIARLDIPLTAEMHRRIFEEFDVNKDGVITLEEFIQGVKKKEAELMPLFDQLDKDGDGYLTFEELRNSALLREVSSEAIQELISFVDSLSTEEPDGRISRREFLSTFTMLPSGENLESLQHFAQHVSEQRRASAELR